jgi:hypothetical protein
MMIRRRRMTVLALAAALVVSLAAQPAAAASLLPYVIYSVPSQADAVAIGDVTGDGLPDIVFTTGYSNNAANDFDLFVLPKEGTGFGPFAHYTTTGTYPARPGSLDLGDVTGDGRADVVVGIDRSGIEVFPGQADGTLGSSTFVATTDSTRVAVGNLDAAPGLEVAGIGWGSNTITTFSGGPAGLTATATYAARHGGYDDLEIGDVSGDGRDDLVVMSGQGLNPNLSVLTRLAGGGFGAAAEYSTGTGALTQGIGLGDVTGDGRVDVVASFGGNRPNSHIAVFPQVAAGTLGAAVVYDSYDIPEPVEVADLDGDARAEVVTLHGGWQRLGIYSGQPSGTLSAEALFSVPYASHYNAQGLAIGDLNGDGRPDIIEADYNSGLVVLTNNTPAAPTAPGAPTLNSATTGDRSVALSWSAPASDGGAAITSYTATASPGGATCSSAGLGCTVSGLANGTTYSFTVRATNSAGAGPASNARSATPATVPTAPRNAAAKAAGAGITVSWAAPTSDGGSAITAYRVYRGTSSTYGTLLATVNANALSFVDTTAPKKVKSYYSIAAVNAIGESPRSAVVSATGR